MEAKSTEWFSCHGGRGSAKEWQADFPSLSLSRPQGYSPFLLSGSVEWEGILQGIGEETTLRMIPILPFTPLVGPFLDLS